MLPWHRHSNIENSQTFINQIFFFCVALLFLSPHRGLYLIPFLLGGFQCSVHREKDSRPCACVRACTNMREKSAERLLSPDDFSPCFHLIKLKVAKIQTDPSLIDLYTLHRTHTINPSLWHHWSKPGSHLKSLVWRKKKKAEVGEGNHDVSREGN